MDGFTLITENVTQSTWNLDKRQRSSIRSGKCKLSKSIKKSGKISTKYTKTDGNKEETQNREQEADHEYYY